jgi:hypothetical protein
MRIYEVTQPGESERTWVNLDAVASASYNPTTPTLILQYLSASKGYPITNSDLINNLAMILGIELGPTP